MHSTFRLVTGLAVGLVLAACGGTVKIGSDLAEYSIGDRDDASTSSSSGGASVPDDFVDADGSKSVVGSVACPYGLPDTSAPMPTDVSYQKECNTPADCSIGLHMNDCCGSMIALGVRASESTRFTADMGICGNEAEICDCGPNPTLAEDGETSRFDDRRDVALACNKGRCETFIALFACGSTTCDSRTEFCEATVPGPMGPIQYKCSPLPVACENDRTCACVTSQQPVFTKCDESKGRITASQFFQ